MFPPAAAPPKSSRNWVLWVVIAVVAVLVLCCVCWFGTGFLSWMAEPVG
jgi:hypothetical protein